MNIIRVIETKFGGFGKVEIIVNENEEIYAKKTFSPRDKEKYPPRLLEKCRQRFIREVQVQKRLPTELFIPVIEENLEGDAPWFIMSFAEKDFSQEIRAARIEDRHPEGLGDILNGLEYMHNKGLYHRDLKPYNILFHDGVWKLSDFGLVTSDPEITALGITSSADQGMGTALYAAPEQVNSFKTVDERADIYSFGAILHDVYGTNERTPYDNFNAPGAIGVIIDRCSKKDPALRFQKIEKLRNALLYILSKPKDNVKTKNAVDVINNLKDIGSYNSEKFNNLIFYLREASNDRSEIMYEMTSDLINVFHNLNTDYFNEFALQYTEWVKKENFSFDYCDVIIGYVKKIYNLSEDVNVKAHCIIAAAELGISHNRWFVMKQVVAIAGDALSDNLAERLAIEIAIDDRIKENFRYCASRIHYTYNVYHATIKEALVA